MPRQDQSLLRHFIWSDGYADDVEGRLQFCFVPPQFVRVVVPDRYGELDGLPLKKC